MDAFKLSIETWEILYELESSFEFIIDKNLKDKYIKYFDIIEKIYLFNMVQINCVKERLKWDRIIPNKIPKKFFYPRICECVDHLGTAPHPIFGGQSTPPTK